MSGQKQKTRRGTGTDMSKIQDRLAAALAACGYEVVEPDATLRVHSHCAGMDAVSWSIKKLGISAQVLVTESDPTAATFHMMHHTSKMIDHIITDFKWVAEGSAGPCFKHGGKMCTWGTKCDLLFSSFVCKPYSSMNNKRIKTMAADAGSDPHGVDTYHHTKTIIARYKPRAFVLENVSGVAVPLAGDEDEPGTTSRRKRPSPADFMLDDLRGAGYEVALLPSVKASEVAKMCQSRPRALFFGVRRGESVDVDSVTRLFKLLGIEYGALREVDKIDDFLDASAWGAVDTRAVEPGAAKNEDAETEYISEYAAARKILRAAHPDSELALPPAPGADRPSDSVPAESPKMRAKIDAAARLNLKKMHTPTCPKTLGCSCHPLADVSQRVDRVNWRVDGSIPTVTTRSRVFSYKLRRFLAPSELAQAMGYPRCSMVPFSSSAAAALVGNGYCVPVCALAVAAAASVVGSVRPKTSKIGPSTAPRPS